MSRQTRAFTTLAACGLALELAGVAAFTYVAGRWPNPGKALVLTSFALSITFLFVVSLPRISFIGRTLLVLTLSLGLVAVVELLGWTVLKGLRHDIDAFSPHHWQALFGTAILGILTFGSLMAVLSIVVLFFSKGRFRK